jgi:hypothetical protein
MLSVLAENMPTVGAVGLVGMYTGTTKSFMKTCVFTPPYETGILVAHILPYAGSHDTRLGRESSWPLLPSGTHFFQAAEGPGIFLRPDR